jgi:phosphocarrier protein HPr
MRETPRVQTQLTLTNKLGLHARAAAAFVRALKNFQVQVTVRWQGRTVNGRSVIDLMTLGAPQGSVLEIQLNGADAEAALATLTTVIENNFYEE